MEGHSEAGTAVSEPMAALCVWQSGAGCLQSQGGKDAGDAVVFTEPLRLWPSLPWMVFTEPLRLWPSVP